MFILRTTPGGAANVLIKFEKSKLNQQSFPLQDSLEWNKLPLTVFPDFTMSRFSNQGFENEGSFFVQS